MATYSAKTTGPGPFYVDLIVTPGTMNIEGNYTPVTWSLRARSTGGSPTWSGDLQQWAVNIGGSTPDGTWVLDFRSTNLIIVAGATVNIAHNADGTRTLNSGGSLYTNHTNFGNGTASGSMVLPRIPRGPRVRYAGTWRNTVAYVRTAGVWRIVVPYVRSGGVWRVGGG